MTRSIPAALLAVFAAVGPAFGQVPGRMGAVPVPAPAATLGRPVPAATLGFPAPVVRANLDEEGVLSGDAATEPHSEGWRIWADAAYLLGVVRGDLLPPLVTTSPAGTRASSAGVLGAPGTSVLVGGFQDNEVNTTARQGFRVDLGYWIVPERQFGVEAGFFFLGGNTETFNVSRDILARPFLNVTTGLQTSVPVAFPGPAGMAASSTGSVQVQDQAHSFYGYNVDLREHFCGCGWWRLDSLLGYRYLHYDEGLTIQETVNPIGGVFAAGTVARITDSFTTGNKMDALDLGMCADFTFGNWSLDVLGRVATGSTRRTVNISGSTVTTVPGVAPATMPGGLLALSTNSGTHTSHEWTSAPELDLTAGWQITQAVKLEVGYSALWWFGVSRPGDQIDLTINPGFIPPPRPAAGSPPSPAFTNIRSDVWLQALTAGLEIRY